MSTKTLDLDDVAALLRLLATAGDPSIAASIPERKLQLVSGLATIVHADVWFWNTCVASPENSCDIMATCMMDGGWKSDQEKMKVLDILANPELAANLQTGVGRLIAEGRAVTVGPRDVAHPVHGEDALRTWSTTGLGDAILTFYPIGRFSFSTLAFHRRNHRPSFGDRERSIVQLVIEEVDWLHRHGAGVPATEKVLQLTMRQRQVLLFLLAGDSLRQVALKMQLSEHTIGDYVKQVYRRFGVNSRGELLAHFISGGQSSQPR